MRKRPVPDDFPAIAPFHTLTELRAIYQCHSSVVRRWQKETGVEIMKKPPQANLGGRQRKMDNPEDIETCLNCKYLTCLERCPKFAKVKKK